MLPCRTAALYRMQITQLSRLSKLYIFSNCFQVFWMSSHFEAMLGVNSITFSCYTENKVPKKGTAGTGMKFQAPVFVKFERYPTLDIASKYCYYAKPYRNVFFVLFTPAAGAASMNAGFFSWSSSLGRVKLQWHHLKHKHKHTFVILSPTAKQRNICWKLTDNCLVLHTSCSWRVGCP